MQCPALKCGRGEAIRRCVPHPLDRFVVKYPKTYMLCNYSLHNTYPFVRVQNDILNAEIAIYLDAIQGQLIVSMGRSLTRETNG